MGQQIVNPDLQRGGHDWQPVLQSRKKNIVTILIVARLQIVLLDDTVLSFKSLFHIGSNMKHKYSKHVLTALKAQINVF